LVPSSIRVLVVDDFEPFRRFVCSTLQNNLDLPTIREASDGLEAIELAHALQPHLILLDIGIPKLNGIEAARRIRELAPQSPILFVSQESSVDVVQAAFSVGASGYVVKMETGRELMTAVRAVLRGERFVGRRFAGHPFSETSDAPTRASTRDNEVLAGQQRQSGEIARRHEVEFYSDDASLLDGFTRFIGTALKTGNAVIVIATELHRVSLPPRLQAHGVDIGTAIEEGRYISLDAADTLSTIMVDSMPDPVRFLKVAGDLILSAARAAKKEHHHVDVCGECSPLLWAQGNAEAAVRLEHLWDEFAKSYDLHVFCGYPLASFQCERGSDVFDRLCAAHSRYLPGDQEKDY
jgi:DNA-binding NarL/FixJ family response regulator